MRFPLILSIVAAALVSMPADSRAAGAAKKPLVVLISGEYEYHSRTTLPAFKQYLEKNYPLECVYIERPAQTNLQEIPNLEVLQKADLAILYIRRMTLPEAQLNQFKAYANSGKPIIGLRTASHAFENWKEWDREVLGGNYHNHANKKLVTTVDAIPAAATHPILKNVPGRFTSVGSLYRNQPLPAGSVPLLMGSIVGEPAEPVAWTHDYKHARIFYTSLGHAEDFSTPAFQQMLVNAIYWGLNQPVPKPTGTEAGKKGGR